MQEFYVDADIRILVAAHLTWLSIDEVLAMLEDGDPAVVVIHKLHRSQHQSATLDPR